MIIDSHAHISAPAGLKVYRDWLIATEGRAGKGQTDITDNDIRSAMLAPLVGSVSHIDGLDKAGISMQLISPRPNQMMHSQKPPEIVKWYTEISNDLVYRYTRLWPKRFIGVAALPQISGEPLTEAVFELRRCVSELGFRGCILNPDPYENSSVQPPPLWDPYWYPLYELLCELEIPCYIHGTGPAASREYYNHYYIHEESIAVLAFVCSDILDIFPKLRVIASHGGGSIPYQIGRYIAGERSRKQRDFKARLKRIYFDTVLHDPVAMEYLLKVIGPDNCLFGTEWPGLGSILDPDTDRTMDNLSQEIQNLTWLSEPQKEAVLYKNAVQIFGLNDYLAD